MAISVIRRPQGHKLSLTQVDASVIDSAGDALFVTTSYHLLITGSYIFVDSNIGYYNQFKYVEVISATTFKVRNSENSAIVPFKQTADVYYRESTLEHGFQCVHLPIVYELASDLYPNDEPGEAYTPNTVASFEDSNGYVKINTTGNLPDAVELLKIRLVGDGPLAGVYQITQVFEEWSVEIDLVYDASYDFTGYTIVKWYDNYAINVNIYAGLSSGHRWEDEKPIGLVATKKFIPDSDNRVLFSIDDILRGYIETVNDLALDTLPNNINFMVEFYIGFYQSYDDVNDDGELYTLTDDESVDDFTGQAINAKNAFKNQYSGYMSEYVSDGENLARWLTDFEVPIAIVGYFFDISFLCPVNGSDIQIIISKRLNGVELASEVLTIENPGKGVIRVPITAESGYDQFCIQAQVEGSPEQILPIDIDDLSEYMNSSIPGGIDWTLGASPTVDIPGQPFPDTEFSEWLYKDYSFVSGRAYEITINYNRTVNSGSANPRTSVLAILDDSFNILFSDSNSDSAGSNSITLAFVANAISNKVGYFHSSGSDVTMDITSIEGSETIAEVDTYTVTEEICIKILDECDSTFDENVRLVETGEIRLLE